ncbi:MAG: DUF5661 family protein [Candidatus Shapirobacteria bacterium]
MKKTFSTAEAKKISEKIGEKLNNKGLAAFKKGLGVEMEHGTEGKSEYGVDTNVTNNDPIKTGKIALAHVNESVDYYKDLGKLESKEKKGALKAIISKITK